MSSADRKSVLVIVRHTPYGNSLARTSLEVALSSATFDQEVALLFMGDGVLHLLPEQDSRDIETRNIAKLIASFPLYELDNLYVDEDALAQYGLNLNQLPQKLQAVDDDAMQQLLRQYDHCLGF